MDKLMESCKRSACHWWQCADISVLWWRCALCWVHSSYVVLLTGVSVCRQQGLQVKPDETSLKEAVAKATHLHQMQRQCMLLTFHVVCRCWVALSCTWWFSHNQQQRHFRSRSLFCFLYTSTHIFSKILYTTYIISDSVQHWQAFQLQVCHKKSHGRNYCLSIVEHHVSWRSSAAAIQTWKHEITPNSAINQRMCLKLVDRWGHRQVLTVRWQASFQFWHYYLLPVFSSFNFSF